MIVPPPSPTKHFYSLGDHLGSLRATSNESGALVHVDDYYPFGMPMPGRNNVEGEEGEAEGKPRYTGHEQEVDIDPDTKAVYYAGARYYDGLLGKWNGTDPLDQYASPYTYVGNNPMAFVDPTGLAGLDCSTSRCGTTYSFSGYAGSGFASHQYLLRDDGTVGVHQRDWGRDEFYIEGPEGPYLLDSDNDDDLAVITAFLISNGTFRAMVSRSRFAPNNVVANAGAVGVRAGQAAFLNHPVTQATLITLGFLVGGPGTALVRGTTAGGRSVFLAATQAARASAAARTGLQVFERAAEFGFRPYNQLLRLKRGTGLEAHHLIEKRFAPTLGVNPRTMLSIALTRAEHRVFTNAWRAIPYGQGTVNATREQILNTARVIYRDYPTILRALGL